jgi:hypothetical protein
MIETALVFRPATGGALEDENRRERRRQALPLSCRR